MRRTLKQSMMLVACSCGLLAVGCIGPNTLNSSMLALEDQSPSTPPFPDLRQLTPGVPCRLLVSTPRQPVVYEGTVAQVDHEKVVLSNARLIGEDREKSGFLGGAFFGKRSNEVEQRIDARGRATIPLYAINDILLHPELTAPSVE